MTREMATRGKDVVAGLAEELDLKVVHHQLVEHEIAARSGLEQKEVHRSLEGEATLLERWRIGRTRLAHYTSQEIMELASEGNVLIRGWGATYLLRNVPHVVCVRICAPMDFRIDTMMERLGVPDRKSARREIERSDAAHNGTMQRLFGIDWSDPSLYALVLNTARIPASDCVHHIAEVARSDAFRETSQTRSVLADELIRTRILSALDRHFGGRDGALGIEVSVDGGHAVVRGTIMAHPLAIDEAEGVVRAVEGVKSARNELLMASLE
jgi:cytidylate kinase